MVMKNIKRHNGSRWIWTTLFFIHCSLFFSISAWAQTFTQRIQKKGQAGEGTLTVTHDQAIDKLVNGQQTAVPVLPKQQADDKTTPTTTGQKKDETKPEAKAPVATPDTTYMPDGRKKVMTNAAKVNGYRVQAFAGGNQRKDRQQAERIGNTIKASYPDEPVYVHFYSPRWICRVGNYRTYEEAHQMLLNIRKLGISGASIVKGKISVQY